jgi:hypothetical protein
LRSAGVAGVKTNTTEPAFLDLAVWPVFFSLYHVVLVVKALLARGSPLLYSQEFAALSPDGSAAP